jgi:hypothetical protein
MLKSPFIAKSRKSRSEARMGSARLPNSIELGVDPTKDFIPWTLDASANAVERGCAGNERRNGSVVRQEFRAI